MAIITARLLTSLLVSALYWPEPTGAIELVNLSMLDCQKLTRTTTACARMANSSSYIGGTTARNYNKMLFWFMIFLILHNRYQRVGEANLLVADHFPWPPSPFTVPTASERQQRNGLSIKVVARYKFRAPNT